MAIPSDEVVQIRHADVAGDPTMVTVSCPDKIGLGYDLCRVVLLFGLNILKADMSTDGRWCYTVLSVAATQRHGQTMAWNLLKERLVELCPMPAPFGIDSSYLAAAGFLDDHVPSVPQVFLLKFCCYDRMGLLHDVTRVLCEMELTIMRVKVSTTPDGRVMDLFFITDASAMIHTAKDSNNTTPPSRQPTTIVIEKKQNRYSSAKRSIELTEGETTNKEIIVQSGQARETEQQ